MLAGKNKRKRKSVTKDSSESQDLTASSSSASTCSSSSTREQKRSKPNSPPLSTIPLPSTIQISQIELEDSVIDAPLDLPNIILEEDSIIMDHAQSQSIIPSMSAPIASTSTMNAPFLPGVNMVFDQTTQPLPTFDVETGGVVSIGDPTWDYKCKLDEQKPEPTKWDNSPKTKSLIDGEQIAYDTFLGFFEKSWKKKEGPPTCKKYMKIMRYYRKKGAPDTAPLECFAFDVPAEHILTGCVKYCSLVKRIEKKWPGLLREEQKKAREQNTKKK